eukprot:scaffold80416_cov49-Tisochrysis_lutea.AAC.2
MTVARRVRRFSRTARASPLSPGGRELPRPGGDGARKASRCKPTGLVVGAVPSVEPPSRSGSSMAASVTAAAIARRLVRPGSWERPRPTTSSLSLEYSHIRSYWKL